MKITKRQLKKIIRESISLKKDSIKLRILDFDDTIAHTGEMVQLKTPKGYRELDSSEYAVYEPKAGEYYDETAFEQFDSVNPELARPVPVVFGILKNFLLAPEGNRIILILTARNQIVEQSVRDFLRLEFEKEDDEQRKQILLKSISDIHFRGVGDSNPSKKVEVIKEYINMLEKDYNIEEVSFFDDSEKNVIAVRDHLNAIGIKHDIAKPESKPEGGTYMPRYRE